LLDELGREGEVRPGNRFRPMGLGTAAALLHQLGDLFAACESAIRDQDRRDAVANNHCDTLGEQIGDGRGSRYDGLVLSEQGLRTTPAAILGDSC
jgi:hypothetical protein